MVIRLLTRASCGRRRDRHGGNGDGSRRGGVRRELPDDDVPSELDGCSTAGGGEQSPTSGQLVVRSKPQAFSRSEPTSGTQRIFYSGLSFRPRRADFESKAHNLAARQSVSDAKLRLNWDTGTPDARPSLVRRSADLWNLASPRVERLQVVAQSVRGASQPSYRKRKKGPDLPFSTSDVAQQSVFVPVTHEMLRTEPVSLGGLGMRCHEVPVPLDS